jgi:hypothetical protein
VVETKCGHCRSFPGRACYCMKVSHELLCRLRIIIACRPPIRVRCVSGERGELGITDGRGASGRCALL